MTPAEILQAYQYLDAFDKLREDVQKSLDKDTKAPPNPHFVNNGIEGSSKRTAQNLFKRRLKAVASDIFSLGGMLASSSTGGVNAADVGKHSASAASTAIHLQRLAAMASKVKDGGSLHRTLISLCAIKSAKLVSRGSKVAVAFIPVPGVSLVAKVVGTVQEKALEYKKAAILKIAFDLHWQAYRELKIGGPAARGPALDICRQLVCLSLTHATGNVESSMDVGSLHSRAGLNDILQEPCGYMVIAHKLNQA